VEERLAIFLSHALLVVKSFHDRILFIDLIQILCPKVLEWLENIGARNRKRRRCGVKRRHDKNGVQDTSKHISFHPLIG
jgi:hypothetical protein